jgi:hypothetical protein
MGSWSAPRFRQLRNTYESAWRTVNAGPSLLLRRGPRRKSLGSHLECWRPAQRQTLTLSRVLLERRHESVCGYRDRRGRHARARPRGERVRRASGGRYRIRREGVTLSNEDLIQRYEQLVDCYPIISIEDGLGEDACRWLRAPSTTKETRGVPWWSDKVSTSECQTAPCVVHLHQRRAGQGADPSRTTASRGKNKRIVLGRCGHVRPVARSVPEVRVWCVAGTPLRGLPRQ